MDSDSDFSDEDVNLQQATPYLPALAELGLDQDFKGLDDDGPPTAEKELKTNLRTHVEGLVSQAKYERNKRILIRKWLRSDPDGRSLDELKRLAVDVENNYLKPTRKLVNECVDELEKDRPDDQLAACYLFSQRVLRPWHCVRTYDCCDVMLERGAAHRLVKVMSRYKEQERWAKLVLLATDVLCILCSSTSRCQIVVRAGAFPVTLSLARTKSGVVQESAIGLLWGLLESQDVQEQAIHQNLLPPMLTVLRNRNANNAVKLRTCGCLFSCALHPQNLKPMLQGGVCEALLPHLKDVPIFKDKELINTGLLACLTLATLLFHYGRLCQAIATSGNILHYNGTVQKVGAKDRVDFTGVDIVKMKIKQWIERRFAFEFSDEHGTEFVWPSLSRFYRLLDGIHLETRMAGCFALQILTHTDNYRVQLKHELGKNMSPLQVGRASNYSYKKNTCLQTCRRFHAEKFHPPSLLDMCILCVSENHTRIPNLQKRLKSLPIRVSGRIYLAEAEPS